MSPATIVHQLDQNIHNYSSLVIDTEVDSLRPTTNLGSDSTWFVGWVVGKTTSERRCLLQFDISELVPASATITGATLYLWLATGALDPATDTLGIHRVTRTWPEDEATWSAYKNPQDGLGYGTAAADATTITASGAPGWTIDEWAGATIRIKSGTDAGDEQVVISNTVDTVTVAGWATTPDVTSTFGFNVWATAGGDYTTPEVTGITAPEHDGNAWVAFTTGAGGTSVLDIVQDARANRDDKVNMIILRDDGIEDNGAMAVFSSETGATNVAPILRVTYTLDSRTYQVFVQ